MSAMTPAQQTTLDEFRHGDGIVGEPNVTEQGEVVFATESGGTVVIAVDGSLAPAPNLTPTGNDAPERAVTEFIVNGVHVRLLIGTDEHGEAYVLLTSPNGYLRGDEPGMYFPTPLDSDDLPAIIAHYVERGDEQYARYLYGDKTVDEWFRTADGTDPDAARSEASR